VLVDPGEQVVEIGWGELPLGGPGACGLYLNSPDI
jgi:hypothetical protein